MTTTVQIQSPAPAAAPRRGGWKPMRVFGAVSGSVLALIGTVMALGGAAVIRVHAFERDDDGFYSTGTELIETGGAAVITEGLDLGTTADTAPDDFLGELRVTAQSTGDGDVFLGVAPKADVASYLAGVEHSVLTDVDDPTYRDVTGGDRAAPPADQSIWAAQAQGSGSQVLDWDVEGGEWAIVLMNADGSQGVAADASLGLNLSWAIWVGIGLLIAGVALTAGGIVLALVMRREANEVA